MAKLYWRVKRDGKWTWRPALVLEEFDYKSFNGKLLKRHVVSSQEDEEE